MLRGNSIHTFDEKGRFIIPSRFREKITSDGGNFMMLTRMSKTVIGYSLNKWDELEQRMEKESRTSKEMSLLCKYLLGAATDCKIDKQGRVVIPPTLREHAELKKEEEIVLVGLMDHVEIWSRKNWDANNEQIEDIIQKGEMHEAIARLGL